MKKLFTFLICLTISLLSMGQGPECGFRKVYCYDLDVTGFNPYTDSRYQYIYDPGLEKQAIADREIWRALHSATPGYKSPLQAGDAHSGRVLFDVGTIDFATPWMTKLCYGSPAQNYSFFAGDAEVTAAYTMQPPGADLTDYILHGSIANGSGGEFKIELKGINFRENEVLCNRFVVFDKYSAANDQARSMMEGFASRFESSILPEYEKNKRDKSNEESNGEVAIDPKFEFDQASYEVEYESLYDMSEEITIILTDCDGEPLKNKEILVEVKKGSILEDKVKTNSAGEAEVTYLAPETSCTDQIRTSWKFKYPSGRTNKVTKSASIKVKAPVTKIVAQITINTNTSTYTPSKEEPRQSTTQNYVITGKLACDIMRNRIIMYNDTPERRSECDAGDHCPVLFGSSNDIVRDPKDVTKKVKDERYPLYVGRDYTEMGYRYVGNQERYVQTIVSKAEGANNIEALQLEIKAYVGAQGTLPSLVPQYVIWLNGAIYLDKLSQHPEGNGSNMHWDDYKEKLVPGNDPNFIGIPYTISDADIRLNENQVYDQLIINDVKGLDDYLLKPVGSYTITANGNRYNKDESFESEGTINVTITFNPAPVEKDPDWDNW